MVGMAPSLDMAAKLLLYLLVLLSGVGLHPGGGQFTDCRLNCGGYAPSLHLVYQPLHPVQQHRCQVGGRHTPFLHFFSHPFSQKCFCLHQSTFTCACFEMQQKNLALSFTVRCRVSRHGSIDHPMSTQVLAGMRLIRLALRGVNRLASTHF